MRLVRVNANELVAQAAGGDIAHDDAAGQAEVAVEPGVPARPTPAHGPFVVRTAEEGGRVRFGVFRCAPDAAAVELDTELEVALALVLGLGLDLWTWPSKPPSIQRQ